MDDDERILWQGAPDPARAVRRWAQDVVASYGMAAVGLVLFAVLTSDLAGPQLRAAYIPLIAILVGLVWAGVQVRSVVRRTRTTTYVLTDRRLVIEQPSGRIELRLANLPELRLGLKGDGYGTIFFARPAGAGLERYARRWQRALGSRDSTELLGPIPRAQQVFELMLDAQARHPLQSDGEAPQRSGFPGGSPIASPEAPLERISFTEAAAEVPLWFSLPFLVIGLGLMAGGVVGGLGSGGIGLLVLGGMFALPGGALVRGRLRHERARRRLEQAGLRVEGRVIELAATGVQVNSDEQWIVRYGYEVRGRPYTGHGAPMPWVGAARWAAGDVISLLVDPVDPSRSVIADLDA